MNLLYLKYAVEVAACGSINKAAEKLYLDQPNLSRTIKELEGSLGVTLFQRSARGMKPTPEGEAFLRQAKTVLHQVDALEGMFRTGEGAKLRFSLSAPRASYIAAAFSAFSRTFTEEESVEVYYKETNAMRVVKNVLEGDYKLGIVRYAECYDSNYKQMFRDKRLAFELVTEFRYQLLCSAVSDLAGKSPVTSADLADKIAVLHADPYVPALPTEEVRKEEAPESPRQVYVFERASQFELLAENPATYMWVSPVPAEWLARYGLVQKACPEGGRLYRDMLIYRKDYTLSAADRAFLSELCRVRREVFEQAEG